MPDLEITRQLPTPPARVFEALTQPAELLKWWGPEGFTVSEGPLDLRTTGPWSSVMVSPDGQPYKVSGHVTHVTADTSVGFTWAWHDEADQRGPESHVVIALAPTPDGGTTLTLSHRDLPNEEAAARHMGGWQSTLNKLEALVAG